MVLGTVAASVIATFEVYHTAKVGLEALVELRVRVFDHLQRLGLQFFAGAQTADLRARVSTDIAAIQDIATSTVGQVLSDLFAVLLGLAAMLWVDWRLALLGSVTIPLLLYPTALISRRAKYLATSAQQKYTYLLGMLDETLVPTGILFTRLFGRNQDNRDEVARRATDLAAIELRKLLTMQAFAIGIQAFVAIQPAIIYWLGGRLIMNRETTLGSIIALVALQRAVVAPAVRLLNARVSLAAAGGVIRRIVEYMQMSPEVVDSSEAYALPAPVGLLKFDNVSFSFKSSDTAILKGVSFAARPGTMTAIVGQSGAGKTTIAHLSARIYDSTSGVVSIDGHSLRDVTMESLSKVVSVVTQDVFLVNASVRENLLYANPSATEEELYTATRSAELHNRIMAMPQGYETRIGQHGAMLSGGERQRLAIARALLRKPRVLVLDEATSALDMLTEQAVLRNLLSESDSRTVIVIAHRLSSIIGADQIVVLGEGAIVEIGTHAELVRKEGHYWKLVRASERPSA